MNNFDFKNPPDNLGEVSFFWWHGDDITKEKLLWILEQLKDKHICGLQINYCHGNSGGISLKKKINLTKNGSRIFFEFDEAIGCCAEIFVGAKKAAVLLTKPYRCDITDFVTDGENEIEVRCYNTLHNHMKTIPTNFNRVLNHDEFMII